MVSYQPVNMVICSPPCNGGVAEQDGLLQYVDVGSLVSGQAELPPVQMLLQSLQRPLLHGCVDLLYFGLKQSRIIDELLNLVVLRVTTDKQVSVSQKNNIYQLAPVFCLNCNVNVNSGIRFLKEDNQQTILPIDAETSLTEKSFTQYENIKGAKDSPHTKTEIRQIRNDNKISRIARLRKNMSNFFKYRTTKKNGKSLSFELVRRIKIDAKYPSL